jgi:hypothetical protein
MAATMLDVKKFFEYDSTSKFMADWKELNETEQAQIKEGIGNGSFNY